MLDGVGIPTDRSALKRPGRRAGGSIYSSAQVDAEAIQGLRASISIQLFALQGDAAAERAGVTSPPVDQRGPERTL